jgi:hypothetical protein
MTLIDGKTIFKRNPERPHRSYLKGVVIEPGLALNETAAILYNVLDGTRDLDSAASEIAQTYDVPHAECLSDCLELVKELESENIIIRVE